MKTKEKSETVKESWGVGITTAWNDLLKSK